MAINASKVRRLPSPPPLEEGAPGIERKSVPPPAAAAAQDEPAPELNLDGRSLRSTGRTINLNFRATPETKAHIVRIAKEQGWPMSQVIEVAIKALLEKQTAK